MTESLSRIDLPLSDNTDKVAYSMAPMVQHNASTPPYDDFHCTQVVSGHRASSISDEVHDAYANPNYGPCYADEAGLGIPLDGYRGPSPAYYYAAAPQSSSPYVQASPLTPQSTHSEVGVQTRSGRKGGSVDNTVASRASSRSRRSKSPRPPKKTAKAGKAEKHKTPKLTEPISELTRDMDVPVKNMDAWVNRSAAVRMKEVEDRKGYITRPMNSFMLYRSAYAERLKQWGVHNNHQIVSSMAGESWPLESAEIREKYNELAKIERINHQNAHPNYKFSPSKAATSKKRKSVDYASDEIDDFSEVEDSDGEWGAGSRNSRSKKQKQLGDPRTGLHQPYSMNMLGLDRSMWDASSEGKPLPQAYGSHYPDSQYYQHSLYPSYTMQGMEDLRTRRIEQTDLAYSMPLAQPLVGLPGGQHHDLLQVGPGLLTPPPARDVQLYQPVMAYDSGFGDALGAGYEPLESAYPVAADFLGTGNPGWHVDPSLQSLDAGIGLGEWMDDER